MKTFPVDKIRKLIKALVQALEDEPNLAGTLIIRGRYEVDKDGEMVVGLDAEAPVLVGGVPVETGLAAGYNRKWDELGNGEFSLRLERQSEATRLLIERLSLVEESIKRLTP